VGVETTGQKQLLHSAFQLAHCLEELMELDTSNKIITLSEDVYDDETLVQNQQKVALTAFCM